MNDLCHETLAEEDLRIVCGFSWKHEFTDVAFEPPCPRKAVRLARLHPDYQDATGMVHPRDDLTGNRWRLTATAYEILDPACEAELVEFIRFSKYPARLIPPLLGALRSFVPSYVSWAKEVHAVFAPRFELWEEVFYMFFPYGSFEKQSLLAQQAVLNRWPDARFKEGPSGLQFLEGPCRKFVA